MYSYNSRDVSVRKLSLNDRRAKGPPSFSSTLLDEIYRSIDDGSARSPRDKETDRAAEKWIEKNRKKKNTELDKKLHYVGDKDNNDAPVFSSGSNSSDSNSSLFSDHDSVPLPTAKTRSSCFLPPKPIRTKTTLAKTEQEHGDQHDVVPKNSTVKSRALKMYAHLKKMKQPISPGMKLTNIINSVVHNSKSKRGVTAAVSDDRSKKPTTKCSSATSFDRSRASYINKKTTPSSNPVKIETDTERPRTLKLKQDDEIRKVVDDDEEEEVEDSSSTSSDRSEDLFEIDHMKLRFTADGSGELPVYETTASKSKTTTISRLSSTTNQSRSIIRGRR